MMKTLFLTSVILVAAASSALAADTFVSNEELGESPIVSTTVASGTSAASPAQPKPVPRTQVHCEIECVDGHDGTLACGNGVGVIQCWNIAAASGMCDGHGGAWSIQCEQVAGPGF